MAQAGEKSQTRLESDFLQQFFFPQNLNRGRRLTFFPLFMTPEKKILAKGFKRKRNGMVEHFWWLDLGIGRLGN